MPLKARMRTIRHSAMRLLRKTGFRKDGVSTTAAAGLLASVGRPLVAIVTLPALLGHLGQAGLGVWMVALSFMGLISTLNGGLTISLATAVGRAQGAESGPGLQELTSAGTLVASVTAIAMLALALPLALLLDWASLLKLGSADAAVQVAHMMVVLVLMLALGMIASVPRQVMVGRMHGYLASLLDLGGVLLSAAALLVAIAAGAPLWGLALAYLLPPTAILAVGGSIYLRRIGLALFSRTHLCGATLRSLGRDSLRMTGYHSAYSVSSQSDLLLIGAFLGAAAAAPYAVAQRVFALPGMAAFAINQAQWPAMARADAAGDHATVARLLRLTLIFGTGPAVLLALVLFVIYAPLLDFWLGRAIPTDPLILAGMVLWVAVSTLSNAADTVLRARNQTATLLRCIVAMATINLAVTVFLLPRVGAAGAIFGSVTGYSLGMLLPYAIILSRNANTRRSGQAGSRGEPPA